MDILKEIEIKKGQRLNKATTEAEKTAALNAAYTQARKVKEQRDINAQRKKSADTQIKGIERQTEAGRDLQAAAQNISKEQQLRNLNRDIYMDMLSKGIYDPKAAEALGVSDGAVRGFVAKVQAEIAAKKAAAAKAARGSDDTYYEEDETVTVSPEVQAQRDAERRAMNDDVSGTGQRGVKITAEEQAEAQRVLFGKNPQAAALTADVNEIKGSVKTNNELESAGSKTEGATAVDQLKSGGHYTSVQVQQKKEQAQKVQKMSADYGFDHGTSMVITQLQALTQRYNVETVMATFLKHNKIREDAYSYTQNLVAEYVIASEKGKDRKLTKDEKVFLSLMKESTQLTDEGKQIIDSILIYDFNTIVDEYKARCNDMNDEALLAEYEKPTQGGLYGQYATMISGEELERREAVDREEALSVLGEYTEEDTDLSEAGHISYVVSVIESKLDALIDPDAAISELEAKINAYKQRGADVSGDEEKLRHYRSNYDQLKREYNDSKKKYEEDLAALNAVDRLTLEYYSASKEERKEYSRQGVPSAGKLTTWWQVVENGKDAGMMSDPEDPTGYTQYTNTMPRYSKADYWNRDAKIAGFSFSYNDLTSEEQDIVNYLLGKYPQFISQDFGNSVGVFEYLHSIESRVMRRITADKTASNAFSAIMNQFGAGAEDSIKNMIYNLAQIKSGEYAGNRTRESQYLWQNAIDKYDIGTVGQFVGTALYTAGQQTPRQIVSALYGSAGRIISDVIFGSDIALSVWSEKKAAGWSDVDAMTYTVLDTAFQTVTEHFLDGFNFGTKGTIINAIEGAINKGVKGGLGRILLKQTISAGSEGLEEFVQGLGEYILEYVQTNGQPESELDWSQLLYDAAIGCALGGVGGISNVVLNAPTEVENDRTRRYAGKSEDLYKKINSSYGHAADDAFLTIHTMAGQGYTLAEVKRHAAKNKFILTGGEINKVYAAGKGSFIQSMSKSAEKAYRRATSLDVQKQSAWLTLYNAGLNNEASYAEYIRSHSEAKELAAVIGLQESREAYEFGAEQGKVFDDQIQQQIKVMKQEQRNKAQDADTGAMPAAEPVSASIEQTVTDQTAPNSDTTVGTAPQQVRQQAYDKFDDGSTQYPTAFNAVYLAGKQLGDFDEAYERVSDILSRDAALEIYSAGSIDRGEAGTTDVQITKPASGSYLRYSRSGKDAEFIDGLDFEAYNEITLPAGEYNRVLSEAMTWHADKINQPFLIILEKNYVCIFNKDHELKVIRVEQSGNIHKKEGIYDGSKSDGEKPDTVIGELGYTEGDSYSRGRFSENGGEKGGGDSAGDRPLSQQGKSDGQRRLEHRPVSHRRNKRKLIRFHDNEDGTVTSWYDDGSVETKPKKGKKSAKKKKEVQSLVDDETAKELFIAGMNGVDIGQVVDMDAVTDERLRAEMQRYYDNGKAKEVHLGTAEGIYRQGRGKVIGKRRGVQADVAMMRKFTKLHHLDVEIRDDGSIEGKAAYDVAAFRILMSKSAGDVHFYHEVFENMLAIRPDLFDQLERSMIECFLQTHSLSELEDAVAEYMVAYETKDYALGRKEWVCSYAAKQLATAQGRRAFTEWLDRSDTERTLWEKIVDFFRRIVRSLRAAANGEYIGTAYRKDGDQLSARLGNVITLLDKTRKYQASLRNGQTITVGGGDGNIRYSLPFHSMKKNDVNRIGWADELFSAEDKILLNDRFVDIMIRKDLGDAVRLKGNSYLLDINNKIVIIGGTFNNPVIRFVMVINTDNATYAQEIKEVIFTHEHLKSLTAREASSGISIYETYFGQEVVRGYNSQDFGYNAQSAHIFASLPKGFASYGYTEKQQDGSRVSGEDGGTGKLNYSRDTATVTKEDVEKVKKTLPSADAVAMGEKTAEMDEVARNSGRLPQGERARRDIAVPRKVSGKKTMRWARTFFESGVGEPDMVDPIAEELLNEGLAYKVIGNNKAIGVAEKIVELKGYEGAINAFAADVDAGKLSKEVVALGQVLLKVAAEKKDAHNFKKLVVMLSEIETIAGQTVQAASMLKRMDGETKLFAVKRLVDKLNKELAEGKYGKKGAGMKITIEDGDGSENVIRVDPDLIARLLEAGEDTAVADAVVVEIQKDIGRQMPHSFNDTWNAWRYLSMLCNPTTHIRNFIGNALFMPVVRMKNSIKRVIELMAVHGENKEYTTKLLPASKAARRFARADAEKMETILKSGGKYNEQDVTEQMRQKLPGFLNKINHWNSAAMEWEDWVFLRYHYASALARYIDINHIDPDSITDVQLKRARDHATREALKATYRDASRLATAINQFSKNNGRVVEMIVEGILPFKKTPINVLRRGMEYSPVGLMDTMLRGAVRVVKGEITVNEWADGFAAGLSGTLIMALGGWLCAMGILQGGFGVDDDDKEDKAQDDLKKLSGVREYSLRIGDVSYTIDWAAPVAIPLFMGVELCEALKEESGNMWDKVWDAVVDGTDVIVNMSMLDGLQGTIDAIKYEDSSVLAIVENSVINYYGQALPTLFGKTASFFDGTGRSNYIDKDSFWPETVQRIANKIKAKAPVWSATRNAYVDEFGRETVENNWALRFVQNFISPGYYSVIRYGELEELMSEIYAEADEPAIIPTVADKSFNVKGKKVYLSAKEYETFAKERGKVAYDIMTKMIRSRNFDALNYNEMQDVLKKAYEYSGALAKSKVSDYKLDDWQKEAYALEKQGVKVSDFILYKYQTKDSENRAEAFQKLRSMGLSEKQAFDYVGRIQPTFKSRTEGTDYVAKDIYTSIVSGGTMHKIIYTNILNAKIKAGKTEKEAKSSIRSELTECFKSAYLNAKNDTERIKIRSQIFQSGAYGTQADVDKTITQWVKDSKK